jgi:hypothetical protein
MLNLNFSNAQKRTLLVRFVQLGIDLHGIAENGGTEHWVGNGGHGSGRKWPILFAGIVLQDARMRDVGSRSIAFGEDQQTFYVAETSPGVFNHGHGGYTSSHRGMPEWGIKHVIAINLDSVSWTNPPYRLCCTANAWTGFVLSAHAMRAKALWKHDALFDYMDRFMAECRARNVAEWEMSWHPWPLEMWDQYRGSF